MAYPTPASSFPQMNCEIEIEMEIQRSSPATAIDSSSVSASSSNPADPMVYDVFINHRGPDTKKTFAGHLYRRLLLNGIRAFLDEQELERGFNFPSQIVGAIRSASVHVAIFSPRYTESPWCLNELLLMLDSGAPIIPVFYKVKPSELRYSEVLHNLEMKTTYDPQTDMTRPRYDCATIHNWRNALSIVAHISGFDLEGAFNGDQIHMLDQVVECVVKRVKKTPFHVAKYPTGLDEKVIDFETTVLKHHQHSGKVQVLGIVGLGGIGKTTLALELFNRKRSNYNKSYFLPDIRENARSSSLHSLQRKVIKGLTQLDLNIDHVHEGTGLLKMHLRSSQVLLILDDIDHDDQLDAFLPIKDVLHSDSLILITSRDREVLRRSGVDNSSIYKLTGLPTKHSRELFCSYAFCQAYPLRGFEVLVNEFLMACRGLPLSLKVIGALLCGKNDDKSFWNDTLSQVHEVPDDIQKRLRISYDTLHEKEQQIFLDIACFFTGEKRDITVGIWDEPGWKGAQRFQNLENKCLVEVDSDNYIHMHDHLRDLGRSIARDTLPRRLWLPTENIDDLLQISSNEQVITQLRGIMMFLKKDTNLYWNSPNERLTWLQRSQELFWNCLSLNNTLQNICYRFLSIGAMKLQILQTEGHLLERILRRVHCPNLLWLSWLDCPYSYLPSWIPMQNLRVLKVEGEVLKTLWQGTSEVPFQLKVLEISGIMNISESIGQLKHVERIFFRRSSFQKLPDEFCFMTSLKVLVLINCTELKALPDSFGNLLNLQHIELSRCIRLQSLPESFGNLTNLQHMKMSWCENFQRLPECFGNLKNLQHIELSACWSLQRLPQSFGNLSNLQHMELSGWGSLHRLPESFGNLRNLQYMKLCSCGSLQRLPESFGNLRNLQHLELSRCKLQHMELSRSDSLQRLPESFVNLTNLRYMELSRCRSLERLPESFGNLTMLKHMELSQCRSLQRLPESFGNLKNLQHMDLSRCRSLQRLPESLGNLTNLQHMDLYRCASLQRLPESLGELTSLQYMKLSHCDSLQGLPESFGNLTNLQHMELFHFHSLGRLPESFGNLRKLQRMKLGGFQSLQRLPESFGNLISLLHMELSDCRILERLPESLGHLTNLRHMELLDCRILQRLPESLGNLMNLEHMELCTCDRLERLPSIKTLVSLVELRVSDCVKLKRIPDLAQLTKLKLLDVDGCLSLEELDGVEHCISLVELNAIKCPKLNLGEGVVNKLCEQNIKINL